MTTLSTTVTLEEGFTVKVATYHLAERVVVEVYDDKEAVLLMYGGQIEFKWSPEVQHAFMTLNTVTGADLIEVIGRASL